jgi:hypothetical protein
MSAHSLGAQRSAAAASRRAADFDGTAACTADDRKPRRLRLGLPRMPRGRCGVRHRNDGRAPDLQRDAVLSSSSCCCE